MTMNGGRALAEMLRAHGCGPMFGMGGFQLLPFYGAIQELGMEHHLVNDERCAAFAADAYARVTSRPGVCDATLGPGATNLVTGLVESLNAGVPVIAIIGDTNRQHSGKNMTQEAEQTHILRPAVKAILRAEFVNRIPELVRRAFQVATSGRPGPVAIDVPEDVCLGRSEFEDGDFYPDLSATSIPSRRTRPDSRDVEAAARVLKRSRRPVILVGGGIHLSGAYAELRALVDYLAIPVAHTISGKGALACTHPLSLGVFGRYSRIANDMIKTADCIVAVGTKLGEISTQRFQLLPDSVPLIHIEIIAEEIGRTTPPPAVGLVGDCKLALQDLLDAVSGSRPERVEYLQELKERIAVWHVEADHRMFSDEIPISMARLVHELNEAMPGRSLLLADGGFASHWTGLLYDTKLAGRHYVSDRGFASIGYGVAGAIGARLRSSTGLSVVSLTGDGGLNMSLGELETAARIGKPFTLIVVNNAASGYVKALQHTMLDGRYQSSDLSDINYADVAKALKCDGITVTQPARLAGALRRPCLNQSGPIVVDVKVTRNPAVMLPGVDNRAAISTPNT